MSALIYLSRADVVELLPPVEEQLELVETTYRSMAAGDVELPPKLGIHPRADGELHAMPTYLKRADAASIKWIAVYRGNKARGLPSINGLVIVSDPETGLPTAVMDATEITAARTVIASAVCIKRWGPPGWQTAAVVGCGVQGARHVAALKALFDPPIVSAYDPHPERVAALGDVRACESAREAVEGAEVVITAIPMTGRRDPQLSLAWLGERYLLVPVDYDACVQRGPIAGADLFVVDDVAQFEYQRGEGSFRGWPEPHGSVGEALGMSGKPKRIACVNLGVGALDAAFANYVLSADARARPRRPPAALA